MIGKTNVTGIDVSASLPILSSPAISTDILVGKQSIDGDGNIINEAMRNLYEDSTIQFQSDNATKVITAIDNKYIGDNTDGVRRLCLRYSGGPGYIFTNNLFGFPVQTKTVNPSTSQQTISADSNKVLEKVVVNAMTNNGSMNATLNCGQSKSIPVGYTSGGTITANSLASQTAGNLAAANMLSGTYGWSNGAKVTGTMANRGAWTSRLANNKKVTIPAGYHNGSGYVQHSTGKGMYYFPMVDEFPGRLNIAAGETISLKSNPNTYDMVGIIFYHSSGDYSCIVANSRTAKTLQHDVPTYTRTAIAGQELYIAFNNDIITVQNKGSSALSFSAFCTLEFTYEGT